MQQDKSRKFGNGRALHRRQQLGLQAQLEVPAELPSHARHGLFARPGRLEAWVRLSNGGPDRAGDATPDVRGFAIQVRGLSGPSALGGECSHQDFLLIQHPAFAFAKTDEFVGVVMAAARGPLHLLPYFLRRYGLGGGLKQLKRAAQTIGKRFKGFAAETFFSAAPIACGPYAARVRLQPVSPQAPAAGTAWAKDIGDRLAAGPLVYELQLQFFADEASTPIEDASVDWPAPYLTVARLTLPRQDPSSAAGRELDARIEAAVFDPWAALAEHRPLGEVMRARKVVYFESQQQRGAA
jgi:hypothetical protein